jgi:ABC-type transport system involved in multi-copper enzyme maturation permease subunit
MALVERLSAQPADRVRGAVLPAGALPDWYLRWLRRTLVGLGPRLWKAVSAYGVGADLLGASLYSLAISQLTIALIGGNAIAGERVDRSTEFLYSLPVTRKRLVASKLLLALLITAIIWLTTAPFLWYLPLQLPSYDRLLGIYGTAAITGLTFLCVAWFLSSFIASPAFAVCGELITPFLVMCSFQFVYWLLMTSGSVTPPIDGWVMELWYCGICLTLAPLCFAVGTWHYLRRVEP